MSTVHAGVADQAGWGPTVDALAVMYTPQSDELEHCRGRSAVEG